MNEYLKELIDKAEYGANFVRKEAKHRLLHECHEWPIEYFTKHKKETCTEGWK